MDILQIDWVNMCLNLELKFGKKKEPQCPIILGLTQPRVHMMQCLI